MEPMYRYLLSYNNIKAGCLFNGEYCGSATSFSMGYKNGQTFRLAEVEKPNCENLWFEVYSSDPESNWGANGTRYEIGQEMPDNMVGTVQLNLKWEWDSYDVVLDPSGYSFTAEAIAQLQAVVPCGYVNNMGQFVIQYRLFNDGVDKNLNYNTASFNELGFTEVPIVSLVGGTSNGWQGVSKVGSQMANCNGVDVDSVNRKIIVHAKVSPGKYYVQFNLNDGATPEESRIFTTSSISFGYGNQMYVLYHNKAWGNALTRRGYVFLGWKAPETYGVNPNLDSSIARYGDDFGAENRQITGETLLPDGGVYVKNLTGVAGGTVIFFAQWEEVKHTVTYNYSYNGGQSASKTTDSVKVDEALDLSVTASKIDNNGVAWDFVGWNTDRYATWVYSDGALIMDEEDVTLYAIYKKYVSATFWNISNGGTSISHTFYNNEQYCYLTCPTVKTISGWQIVGWGSTPTATSRSYNSGGSYYMTTSSVGRTYYAVYSYDVTVSYLPNGASGSTEASVGTAYATAINGNGTYNTTKATVSLKTNGFTPKEGFSFQGWSEISEATSGLVEGTTLTLDENKTYYATWRKGLQVSFYQIGETDPTILVKYIYNQDTSTDWVTTVPDVETYGDYETVVGWTKNPASSAIDLVAGTRSVLTNGTSYYAVCSKPVVLKYDAGGKVIANELPDDETKNIYAVASTQTTPNYIKTSFKVTDIIPLTSGSIFHGWNDRADLQGNTYYKNDTIENVDADLVLYATWGNASLRLEISDIVTSYSVQLQQFTFDGATEGTGDYTYSLFSQKDATTEQDVSWFAVNSTTLIVASTTPSGEYRVVVKVKDNVSSLEATSGFKVTINYLAINVPTANTGLVYSGREQIGVSEGAGYTLVDNKAINSGNYIAKVTLGNNYRWTDGTRETKEVAWMIDYVQVAIPTAVSGLIYSGGEQVGVVELAGYTVTDNKATNAGNYVAKATVKENYKWTDGTREVKDIDWMIDYATINVPTAVSGLIYSGREQIGVVAGAGYTLTNNTGIDAGDYAATAIILENYKWVGGTRLNKTINWSIEQKDLSIIWPSMTEYLYDGRAHKVEANLNGVYSGDIITINYKNEIDKINVGEYTTTIVSLNGERAGNYQLPTDNLSCSWEIKKCVVYTIWKTTEFTFDGNAHNPTYELFGNISTEMLILKLSSKDFINAGTYNVTASIDSVIGGQESASNYDLTNTSVEVKINKANIAVVQEPRVFDLTYTGFNQYLISEGSTFHGTFMYSADGETWQTSVPVAKDANQYVVYYKVLGDKNHNDIQAVQLTARINKRDITVEWSDELSFTYNGEEHIPQATAKWQDYELTLVHILQGRN
ncbi:MAG: InlB B-repeat-containing protein [Clostridia bacterium]|nr:InlB B-repeat-containing protein [Clostridia bacterium]